MSFIFLNVPILSGPGPGFDCLTIDHREMMTANTAHSGKNLGSTMSVRVLPRYNCNSRCKFFKVTCKSCNSLFQVSASDVSRKKSQDDDSQQGTQWEKSMIYNVCQSAA